MRTFLTLLALGALLQQPPSYSPVQDGEAHGDPPYLLGWQPLLNRQKDVDAEGPTRAHLSIPEAAQSPIMIQGDHGPVALRNIHVRSLRPLIVR